MEEPAVVRKKGGRPPSAKKRDKHLTVYFTALELLAVKRRAEHAGLNLSDYCRQMILSGKAQARLTPEENAMLNQVVKLGNNLNQLAHKAHADGIRSVAVEAQRLLRQLDTLLNKTAEE